MKEYPCTPQSFGVTAVSYSWAKCPFTDTDPASACGPLDPAPFDNRSHVAVVPCAYSNCSLEEKANNLGQANYVAFITWNDNNCSNSELNEGVVYWNNYCCAVCRLLEHAKCFNGLLRALLSCLAVNAFFHSYWLFHLYGGFPQLLQTTCWSLLCGSSGSR